MSDNDASCSALGIPERLHTNGRIADTHFLPDEVVYRRFTVPGPKETWSMAGNDPSVRIFDLSEDSYNRSKYSQSAEDVLFNVRPEDVGRHYIDSGILEINVSQLLSPSTVYIINEGNGNKRTFTFDVKHTPQSCMYPHTDVIVLENGQEAVKRPTSAKRVLRLILLEYLNIVKPYIPAQNK